MGNSLPHGLGRSGHWLDMLGGGKGKVNVWQNVASDQFNHNRHIEFRVVLLHVLRPVLLSELLHHRFRRFCIRDGNGSEFRFHAPRINSNRRIIEHVPVPLGVGALHGQEVQVFAF